MSELELESRDHHHASDDPLLEGLKGELQSESARTRLLATFILERFGSGPQVLHALKGRISSEPDETLRAHTRRSYLRLKKKMEDQLAADMQLLTDSTPPRVDVRRLTHYLAHPNSVLRIQAALVAAEAHDPAALEPALKRLQVENDEWVLATLVRVVGQLGSLEHVGAIRQYLERTDHPRLVANTIEALSLLGHEAVVPLIRPFLASVDPRIQGAAARCLFHLTPESCLGRMGLLQRVGRAQAQAPLHHRTHGLD